MGRYRLPFPFHPRWSVAEDRVAMTLSLGALDIASVRRQHDGWVVDVLLTHLLDGDPARVAVPSRLRGRRWAERWAHEHAPQIVSGHQGAAARGRSVPSEDADDARRVRPEKIATGADVPADGPARSRAASVFGHALLDARRPFGRDAHDAAPS